jgi:hypothetical protein
LEAGIERANYGYFGGTRHVVSWEALGEYSRTGKGSSVAEKQAVGLAAGMDG